MTKKRSKNKQKSKNNYEIRVKNQVNHQSSHINLDTLEYQDYPLTNSAELSLNDIPVNTSSHQLALNITPSHIEQIQSTYTNTLSQPNDRILSTYNSMSPLVSHTSFYNLLTYDNPINDSTIESFFSILKQTNHSEVGNMLTTNTSSTPTALTMLKEHNQNHVTMPIQY
jgi:hypothetical protein